jgi:3-oxoacyl-[acyl-carrier-protein] synthase-3
MPASPAPAATDDGLPAGRTATVTAVGHFLPEGRLTNADLEGMVDTSDEWIQKRTGIRERRILRDPEKATSYMATRAAEELLDKRGLAAGELDAIVVGTVTPDMFYPATACLVQAELGATGAFGYDVSAACSGFLYALSAGAGHVASGQCEKVLVIGADKMSSIVDYTDRSTCILFGDGAGAVLLEPSRDGHGLRDMHQRVDGSEWENLCQPGGGSRQPPTHQSVDRRDHFLKQNGRPVFKQAVQRMAEASLTVMQRNGLAPEDVDYLVPHQANRRIIEATARQMDLPLEKAMMNIGAYGNTTAATLPLCLHDWEADLRKGDRLILTTFGGGYTWGAGLLTWEYNGEEAQKTMADEASPADGG